VVGRMEGFFVAKIRWTSFSVGFSNLMSTINLAPWMVMVVVNYWPSVSPFI